MSFDVAKAMQEIPMPKKVYGAINAITGELAKIGISKARKNTQQGYAFRGIDDVYAALSSLLATHRLCVIPRVLSREVTTQPSKSGGILFYAVLDVEFDLVSADDGSMHTARVCGEAMDSGDKATNKAMSAAYKYFALQTFCIPTEGDNDADSTTHEVVIVQGHKLEAPPVDDRAALNAARQMRDILGADEEEPKKALQVLDYHDNLNLHQDIYRAAADALTAKERAAWKAYVRQAQKAQEIDRQYSPNGR